MKIDYSIEFEPLPGTPTAEELNEIRLKTYIEGLLEDQNKELAMFLAGISALLGAFGWLLVTWYSGLQAFWMPLPVALLVGWVVRRFGQGIEMKFGWIGAGFALAGSAFGNYMAIIRACALEYKMSFIEVFGQMGVSDFPEAVVEGFGFHNILTLVAALAIAFFISYRKISKAEIERIKGSGIS
ncbi:MAG: hypothetical protein H6581_26310 [Bacteroidia bacterium]|nr:hypothetical protein [Bacteroidia bacterium]